MYSFTNIDFSYLAAAINAFYRFGNEDCWYRIVAPNVGKQIMRRALERVSAVTLLRSEQILLHDDRSIRSYCDRDFLSELAKFGFCFFSEAKANSLELLLPKWKVPLFDAHLISNICKQLSRSPKVDRKNQWDKYFRLARKPKGDFADINSVYHCGGASYFKFLKEISYSGSEKFKGTTNLAAAFEFNLPIFDFNSLMDNPYSNTRVTSFSSDPNSKTYDCLKGLYYEIVK